MSAAERATEMAKAGAKPTAEEYAARRLRRRDWDGYLAIDTVDHIAERIRRLIGDGQRYTWVARNTTQSRIFPEVRTGQRVEPSRATDRVGIKVTKDGYAHLWVVDTYGVWGIHSTHATEAAARRAAEKDGDRSTTHVTIEGVGDGTRDRIEITQFNGYGEVLHWVIAPEHEPLREPVRQPFRPQYDQDGALAAEDICDQVPDPVRWAILNEILTGPGEPDTTSLTESLRARYAALDVKVRPWAHTETLAVQP